MEIKENSPENSAVRSKIVTFLSEHKIPVSVTAVLTALCVLGASATVIYARTKPKETPEAQSVISKTEEPVTLSEPPTVSEVSEVSSETESVVNVKPVASPSSAAVKKPAVKNTQTASTPQTVSSGEYKYNSNSDIDDNVFLDSLIYTGYNIKKHRADGMMWQYVLASQKRGLGWLSNITYGGGSTGYETSGGKPDIKYFEKHGLVCASYVTYVYFNYLPNVAGINTMSLPKPERSYSANDWYLALKQWVNKGYSKKIGFTASKTPSGFINFKPAESIPIGSIIVFCDAKKRSDFGSHVAIYAGYKNNYNWVFHVGNSNGPEFCAVERMHFGPDPQWPIAVITPPANIRMSALLEINVTDENGSPVSGAVFSLKNSKTGATVNLGAANGGRLTKEGLSYGDYTLSFTVPAGYTADSTVKAIKLTTANNSKNTVSIKLTAIPPVKEEPPAESEQDISDTSETESESNNPPSESSEEEITE
ncbi:MAG: prealbumin-like fold domain-containing protein [Acutalibacteraceae bacterium]